jgi:branched-chain amino acid transport system substrate-binding protein
MVRMNFLLGIALLWMAQLAHAKELVIGQVAPILDPLVAGFQMKSGIELYFDAINQAGGVHGATLRLAVKDRAPQVAADAVPKTRELIEEHKPLALIGLAGTGPMEALLKQGVLEAAGLPVIGIRTGATSLHQPVHPLLFHTRANYAIEAEKIVRHMNTMGLKKIAVFHEDSPFGREALKHTLASLEKSRFKALAVASYPANTNEVQPALKAITAVSPDAVIAASSSSAAAQMFKGLNQSGATRIQMVNFSTVDAAIVVKLIGRIDARGLGIAQVVPDPENRRTPIVREFQDHVKSLRDAKYEMTQGALEGYIAAKVLVEGLRRAGPNPTAAKLRQALEKISNFDAGGLVVNFSPRNHSGSSYVNIGILASDGKLMN